LYDFSCFTQDWKVSYFLGQLRAYIHVINSVASLRPLGAFAKFRKANFGFVMFVLLSDWNNLALTGRILMKFDI
jgi:hypothetical protein